MFSSELIFEKFQGINFEELFYFCFYILLSFLSSYWICNWFYLTIQQNDYNFFEKFRIQQNKPKFNKENNKKKYENIFYETFKYQIISAILSPSIYFIMKTRGNLHISIFDFPDIYTTIFQLLFYILLEDVNFIFI
jgi:hypothetical protein